jgi:uncharacterized protein with PQ loop repeat
MSYLKIVLKKIKSFDNASSNRKIEFIVLFMGVIEPLFTLPQTYNIWAKHETTGVSLITWVFFTIAAIVWCIYGVVINSKPLVISYALYTIFNGIVVVGLLTH